MPLPLPLVEFARRMRKEQTDAERLLWSLLRNRNFCGLKFRRQYPVGGYILDFFCDAANLAVELDGSGHGAADQMAYDAERSRVLSGDGIRVIRFWNHEVLEQTEAVLEELHRQLQIVANPPHPASGHLLPQGEGIKELPLP